MTAVASPGLGSRQTLVKKMRPVPQFVGPVWDDLAMYPLKEEKMLGYRPRTNRESRHCFLVQLSDVPMDGTGSRRLSRELGPHHKVGLHIDFCQLIEVDDCFCWALSQSTTLLCG